MASTRLRHLATAGLLVASALLLSGCSSPMRSHAPGSEQAPVRAPSTHGPRQRVVNTALAALGTPYRYGGDGPHGFDCSGLVQYSHAAAGVRVPRVTTQQRRHARPVPLSRLQPGDLVFFHIEPKGRHVGIYLGNGDFIHAPSSGKRVSISNLQQRYWQERLVAAGSYL